MPHGRLEQFDTPAAIYAHPATPFVLDFVGMSTRLAGTVAATDGDALVVDTAAGRVRARGRAAAGSAVLVAVRPENMRVGARGDNAIALKVRDRVFLGSKLLVHFDAPGGDQIVSELAPGDAADAAPGDLVTVSWSIDATLVYSAP
jgi:putative spermidine/putrescine transport system ATP-binding protein